MIVNRLIGVRGGGGLRSDSCQVSIFQLSAYTDKRIDRQIGRQTDRERETGRQTDRQRERD